MLYRCLARDRAARARRDAGGFDVEDSTVEAAERPARSPRPQPAAEGRRPRPRQRVRLRQPGRRMTDLTSLTLAEARERAAQEGILRRRARRRASRRDREGARAQRLCAGDAGARARHGEAPPTRASRAGEARPLEGMPLAIKDLFCTEGVRTTACSHILDDFVPTYESTVTANLWRDGAVMLGKTNNDEFAMGSSNETSFFGPVTSPWRRKGANTPLVPGGSSGGSAAAVAAHLCARRDRHRHRRLDPPARGVHRHRRHQADLRPLLALGHRRLRLLARPGRAVRAHGARRRDPAAARWPATIRRTRPRSIVPVPDYEAAVGTLGQGPEDRHPEGIPRRRHVGRDRGAVGAGQGLARRRPAPRSSRSRCRTPSTRCRPITSWRRRRPRPTSRATTACATACACRAATSPSMYEKTRAAGFGTEVRRRIMIGTYVLSAGYYDAYYLQAQKVRTLIKRDFEDCFAQGRRRDADADDAVGRLRHRREGRHDPIEMYLNDVFTVTVNMAGLPGISVPAGLDGEGLPLGLQLIGRPFDEETLFSLGR